jgi:hypothetical protein
MARAHQVSTVTERSDRFDRALGRRRGGQRPQSAPVNAIDTQSAQLQQTHEHAGRTVEQIRAEISGLTEALVRMLVAAEGATVPVLVGQASGFTGKGVYVAEVSWGGRSRGRSRGHATVLAIASPSTLGGLDAPELLSVPESPGAPPFQLQGSLALIKGGQYGVKLAGEQTLVSFAASLPLIVDSLQTHARERDARASSSLNALAAAKASLS